MTFQPDEARDKDGKWTANPADDALALKEDARRIGLAATKVATDLNYDPAKISVRTDEMKFQLNGQSYDYAGAAYITGPRLGEIELFAKHLAPSDIDAVTAHEIGHQKFQAFFNDYLAERDRMTEAMHTTDLNKFMKPDGTLRKPYDTEYPLVQKYTEVMMPSVSEEFAKSDGITPYSEKWWQAWKDGKANTQQAFHETLAEMTAREYTKGPDPEVETGKFKAAGYSLDQSFGRYRDPAKYWVRKWGGGPERVDESTLPSELQSSLGKLRERADYESRLINPSTATGKYKDPAPEWVKLYDAIKENWDSKHK